MSLTPMSLTLKPLHPLFAAQVTGIDLKVALDEATIAAIDAAMDQYAVLVFRDQFLDQAQQIAYSKQFGPLDAGLRKATGAATRFQYEELIDVGNIAMDGSVAAANNTKLIGVLANQLWHSDSTFQNLPIKYSMLSAVVVPDEGGQTQWADLRAAWDALPEKTKQYAEDRIARHTAFHSRISLGDDRYTDEQLKRFPPVERALVHTHPAGRRVLFPSVHIESLSGLTVPEGRLLVAELIEHATQREFVYTHDWRLGDYVMWDNRSTLHRGLRYDLSKRRDLRRTTTLERGYAHALAA
jgi:alpha-ketoglutarate-dependent 2,4-dichlorophenoxyacetate dioxygenase